MKKKHGCLSPLSSMSCILLKMMKKGMIPSQSFKLHIIILFKLKSWLCSNIPWLCHSEQKKATKWHHSYQTYSSLRYWYFCNWQTRRFHQATSFEEKKNKKKYMAYGDKLLGVQELGKVWFFFCKPGSDFLFCACLACLDDSCCVSAEPLLLCWPSVATLPSLSVVVLTP